MDFPEQEWLEAHRMNKVIANATRGCSGLVYVHLPSGIVPVWVGGWPLPPDPVDDDDDDDIFDEWWDWTTYDDE